MHDELKLKPPGFRYPAEWEPQEAVWFAWPVREDLWPGVLERVRHQMVQLYALAARFEPVRVLCPREAQDDLRARLHAEGVVDGITLFDYRTDDVWCRDFGPIFLLSNDGTECVLADWRYNAWGDKFPAQARDNAAPGWIADALGLRRFASEFVLEGGAIESNGAGHILTTEAVLLNPNRNGTVGKGEVERILKAGLGAEEVLWLGEGLAGDDTDGHIDNLARFFREDGILMAERAPGDDPNVDRLLANVERLRRFRTPAGRPYAVVQLPLPEPVAFEGERLAASYLNYLVLNGGVIVPTYGQAEHDAEAMAIVGDCFPGRQIVGFDCRDIIREGGAIHCMSQHQPAVRA